MALCTAKKQVMYVYACTPKASSPVQSTCTPQEAQLENLECKVLAAGRRASNNAGHLHTKQGSPQTLHQQHAQAATFTRLPRRQHSPKSRVSKLHKVLSSKQESQRSTHPAKHGSTSQLSRPSQWALLKGFVDAASHAKQAQRLRSGKPAAAPMLLAEGRHTCMHQDLRQHTPQAFRRQVKSGVP